MSRFTQVGALSSKEQQKPVSDFRAGLGNVKPPKSEPIKQDKEMVEYTNVMKELEVSLTAFKKRTKIHHHQQNVNIEEANNKGGKNEQSSVKENNDNEIISIKSGYNQYLYIQNNKTTKKQLVFDIEMKPQPELKESGGGEGGEGEGGGVDIINTTSTKTSKTACELTIILDISGSMNGNPLEYSKMAILELISKLSENDYVNLVTYESTSQVQFSGLLTTVNRAEVVESVKQIETAGCTNIVSGIVTAIETISATTTPNVNRRVFIFSDGEINVGVQDRSQILNIIGYIQQHFQINFTSFGFGNHFDEALMSGIARVGKGDFFFISSADDISFKVNKGLEVFQSLYAMNATFDVSSSVVRFLSCHGYSDAISKSSYQLSLGDLSYDDLRQLLFTFQYPLSFLKNNNNNSQPAAANNNNIHDDNDGGSGDDGSGSSSGSSSGGGGGGSSSGNIELLKYTLTFQTVEDGVVRSMTGSIYGVITEDEALLAEIPDSLKVAKAIEYSAQTDMEILTFVSNCKYDTALELKKKALKQLEDVLEIDTTGVIVHLISKTNSLITSLQQKSVSTKEVSYSRFQASIVHRKCF